MNDAEGDEHDGREPDVDDEYELGWPEQVNQERALKTCGGYANFGGDQWVGVNDGEPALGSLDGEINQAKWSKGNRRDLEEQCEDEGHDGDTEADHADHEPRLPPFTLNQGSEGPL